MGMLWVIAGEGKGAGKTRLALELCRALPGAVYAKKGRGRRKGGKPSHFFTRREDLQAFLEKALPAHPHLVVEDQGLARRGRGDFLFFVEGGGRVARPRADAAQTRKKAHLVLGPLPDPSLWRRALEAELPDPALVGRVLQALESFYREGEGREFSVRSKLWLLRGGKFVFGPGLWALLEGVESRGSLREAAREVGISYRRAWDLVREAEINLGAPILLKSPGGAGGGGSRLSPAGRRLLGIFRKVQGEVEEFARSRFQDLLGLERGKRKKGGVPG